MYMSLDQIMRAACLPVAPQVAGIHNHVNSQGKVVSQTYTIVPAAAGTQVLVMPGSTPVQAAAGTQVLMVPPQAAAPANTVVPQPVQIVQTQQPTQQVQVVQQQPGMQQVQMVQQQPMMPVAGPMPSTAGSTIVAAQPMYGKH